MIHYEAIHSNYAADKRWNAHTHTHNSIHCLMINCICEMANKIHMLCVSCWWCLLVCIVYSTSILYKLVIIQIISRTALCFAWQCVAVWLCVMRNTLTYLTFYFAHRISIYIDFVMCVMCMYSRGTNHMKIYYILIMDYQYHDWRWAIEHFHTQEIFCLFSVCFLYYFLLFFFCRRTK